MATTFTKIADYTVGAGGQSSIVFSVIPSTYTDLVIKLSGRRAGSGYSDGFSVAVNGGTNYADIELYNQNGGAASYGVRTSSTEMFMGQVPASSATANTFGNHEIYIPNYLSTGVKSLSSDGTSENNGTQIYQTLIAGTITNGAAISSITLAAYGDNFVQYTTATLYGVKNA